MKRAKVPFSSVFSKHYWLGGHLPEKQLQADIWEHLLSRVLPILPISLYLKYNLLLVVIALLTDPDASGNRNLQFLGLRIKLYSLLSARTKGLAKQTVLSPVPPSLLVQPSIKHRSPGTTSARLSLASSRKRPLSGAQPATDPCCDLLHPGNCDALACDGMQTAP